MTPLIESSRCSVIRDPKEESAHSKQNKTTCKTKGCPDEGWQMHGINATLFHPTPWQTPPINCGTLSCIDCDFSMLRSTKLRRPPLPVWDFIFSVGMLLNRDPAQWVCLGQACSVWVLDFVQEKFHNTSPSDFEKMFVKAEDSETRKALGQKTQQDRA